MKLRSGDETHLGAPHDKTCLIRTDVSLNLEFRLKPNDLPKPN